jgi:hypothetical protein
MGTETVRFATKLDDKKGTSMTKDETLKLALETLKRCVATCFDPYAHEQVMSRPEHFVNQTITAIKEALAQLEQEPVAYLTKRKLGGSEGLLRADMVDRSAKNQETHYFIPLYTAPPQRTWVGLTDGVMCDIAIEHGLMSIDWIDFARAIEAKLKEKNFD